MTGEWIGRREREYKISNIPIIKESVSTVTLGPRLREGRTKEQWRNSLSQSINVTTRSRGEESHRLQKRNRAKFKSSMLFLR